MSKPRVALLGVGLMGSGMAGRLLSAKFPLTIYNRNRDRAMPLTEAGAMVVNSAREAASGAEIVICMVADDTASRSVWLGENGALAGAAPGSLLIESSTLTVKWIKELATAVAGHGCELLDAPVTGSKPQAASGELLFLVGGSETALEAARPVLSVLGRDVVHFGGVGSGTMMKLINNFMSGVQAASLAEAAAFIEAGGIDRDKALSVLTNGAPGSPLIKLLVSRATAGDFRPNFLLKLMAKDLRYAVEEAAQLHLALQTSAAALSVFQEGITGGYGDKDFSAVIESAVQRQKIRS